ncbi:MAG: hypothetical protein CMC70_01620 [Flavobacteriaceae bacterium]|nr:hypothetical protein [Flavobacteriaceae bacterium]
MLYCLGPLQQPLADGFHKLEHAILDTNGNHSHDVAQDQNIAHGHDHKLLQFVNNLFSEDAQGDQKPVKELKLDKHILQEYSIEKVQILIASEKNYNYTSGTYSVSLPFVLPPPERDFS